MIRHRNYGPTLWNFTNPNLNPNPPEKFRAIQEGRLSDVTVEEISEARKQHLAELGGNSDGQLPKDLANPPGFVGVVYDWILRSSVCPQPMFALAAALVLNGTIFGRKITSTLGQFTNLFALAVGKTSSGKDYPRQAILSVLDAADAGHLWRSKVTSDAAIEAALAEESNLLVTIDEAGHFFKTANSRSGGCANTIKPTLLELWSSAGKMWKGKQRARANGKPQSVIVVNNPCVSFFGATQPEVFLNGVKDEDIRDGWIQRNLFFYSRHLQRPEIKESSEMPHEIVATVKKWTEETEPATTNEEEENPSTASMEAAPNYGVQETPKPIAVPISEDAKELLNEFADEVFQLTSSESTFAALYGKVIENTIRVALILAVSQHVNDPENAIISTGDISYAFNLVKFLAMTIEDVFRANLAENGTERDNKRLLRIIKDAGCEGITTSFLTAKSRWLNGASRRKILDELITCGDIKEIPTAKGGSRFVALANGSACM